MSFAAAAGHRVCGEWCGATQRRAPGGDEGVLHEIAGHFVFVDYGAHEGVERTLPTVENRLQQQLGRRRGGGGDWRIGGGHRCLFQTGRSMIYMPPQALTESG